LYCNLVLQYACSLSNADPTQLIRDGTTTDTITADPTGPTALDANGNLLFGMHEPYADYLACATRSRNKGLWISDRTVGNQATSDRQNNNANRNGLECAEERDYYPYWHPTIWRDIAILTNDLSWCSYYQAQSQNVQSKNFCRDPATQAPTAENNQADCTTQAHEWVTVPAWGIAAPDCVRAPWSRDNHLGSGTLLPGYENMYNWTLPVQKDLPCIAKDNCNCVLRIRYNISSNDLGPTGNRPDTGYVDWTSNGNASPVKNDAIISQDGAPHQLALDTTQYGRTFQDRSHVFHIKPRPTGVFSTARIFNLNVKGKRGNIVQAYPATEYDFIPESLQARVGDYIHFQWTGCDTNPAGNAGEGTDQTDRNNMVQIETIGHNVPVSDDKIASGAVVPLFETKDLRLRMAMLGQTGCLSYDDLKAKDNNNNNNIEQDLQNCMKLNAAEPYFDGGLIKMNKTGVFYYMSSRNNNFTNRGQKGVIYVNALLPTWAIVVVVVGAASFVLSAGVAGAVLYARSHPHSSIANAFSRM